MLNFIITAHIVVSLVIIMLVLIQHGKGANMGASFGAGSSQTVFGSRGASSFLFKVTSLMIVIFFTTSIFLSYIGKRDQSNGLINQTASQVGLSKLDYEKQEAQQRKIIEQIKRQENGQKI